MADALPHDLTAERAVLAAMLLKPSVIPKTAETLPPSAFYSHRHRAIYSAILAVQAVYGDATDLVLVRSRLDLSGALQDAGGVGYLIGILDGIARSDSVDGYARVVLECAQRRDAATFGLEIQDMAKQPGGIPAAASYARKWAELAERNGRVEEPRLLSLVSAMDGEEPTVPWLIRGWLARGELCILGGEWATGKSYVALDLALSVAAGMPWLGRVEVFGLAPVVYVDEENPTYVAMRRLRRMVLGRNLEPAEIASLPLHYLHGNAVRLDKQDGMSLLSRVLEKVGARLLILDSLIRFHGADENDNRAFADVVGRNLRSLSARHDCAIVALDHLRKPGKGDDAVDDGHRLRGASDKAGAVDDLWLLQGNRDQDTRRLSQHKSRGGDGLVTPLTTKYVESEDGTACWIEASDATATNSAAVVGIVAEAGNGGIYAADLIAELGSRGCPRRSAYYAISEAIKAGDIHREKVGRRILYRGTRN